MTRFLLIRHAPHILQGRVLVGRGGAAPLDPTAAPPVLDRLLRHLAGEAITHVQSSPLERAQATAAAIATPRGLAVEIIPALTEVDFGRWTGRAHGDLDADPGWRRWNAFRSGTSPPDGEAMAQVQLRIVSHMRVLRDADPDGTIALVFHGDPIRAALAFWLGVPLDLFLRIELAPGSVSRVELGDWGVRVVDVNQGGGW